jgi:hypothetical protein
MKTLPFVLLCIIAICFVACKKNSPTVYPSHQGSITGSGTITMNPETKFTHFIRFDTTIAGAPSTSIGIDCSIDTSNFNISLANIRNTGKYNLGQNYDSLPYTTAIITYSDATSMALYSSLLTSLYTTNNPGTVTITAISTSSITGTYSAILTSTSNSSISISGTFTGSF